jgi:hypothetical protein
MTKRLFLLTAVIMWWATSLHAEVWCGRGASPSLNHACVPAAKATISRRAFLDSRDEWMAQKGVWSVESAKSVSGGEEIWVSVGPDFANPNRTEIPASESGVPVVIVPASTEKLGVIIREGTFGPTPSGAQKRQPQNSVGAEEAYSDVVHANSEYWLALPGVIGIGPARCSDDGCDFSSVGVIVQPQLLKSTQKQIPSYINGVPIVLIPQD